MRHFHLHDFFGEHLIIRGTGTVGRIIENAFIEAGSFRELNISANVRFQYHRRAPGLIAIPTAVEKLFNLFGDFTGKPRGGFILAKQNSTDAQRGIESFTHHGTGFQ